MRRNPTPAVTAKMYRHFAMTTVAVTALIALFASGDEQDAAAAETNPVVQASPKPDAKPKQEIEAAEAADADSGGWGSDVDFGHPSSIVAYDGSSWSPDDGPWQPDLSAPVASDDGLTAAERDDLARATARGGAAQPPPDQQG